MRKTGFLVMAAIAFAMCGPGIVSSKEIIHDAEYYVLEAQHGEKWAAEDKEFDKKLA